MPAIGNPECQGKPEQICQPPTDTEQLHKLNDAMVGVERQ
jgi:hypothetical protein